MTPKVLVEVVVEHKDEPEQLRTINRLFLSQPTQSLERIRPALEEAIRRLRHHMAEEEAELFPLLERTLAAAEAPIVAPHPRGPFNETTTVNRMVREFPRTRPVFDRLFINVPLEGCACLDEVAWRHGMDARELLGQLEQAIGACGCV